MIRVGQAMARPADLARDGVPTQLLVLRLGAPRRHLGDARAELRALRLRTRVGAGGGRGSPRAGGVVAPAARDLRAGPPGDSARAADALRGRAARLRRRRRAGRDNRRRAGRLRAAPLRTEAHRLTGRAGSGGAILDADWTSLVPIATKSVQSGSEARHRPPPAGGCRPPPGKDAAGDAWWT